MHLTGILDVCSASIWSTLQALVELPDAWVELADFLVELPDPSAKLELHIRKQSHLLGPGEYSQLESAILNFQICGFLKTVFLLQLK